MHDPTIVENGERMTMTGEASFVVELLNIEPKAVQVKLLPWFKPFQDEFKAIVARELTHVRFLHYSARHLNVVCGPYSYEKVQDIVVRALTELVDRRP
jgi:hypothetical protein